MAGVHKACWDLGLWRKFFTSSALEKKMSRELLTACTHGDAECPKMALSSKDQALRMDWKKDAFTSTAICYPWPCVGWFVPPCHLPSCGCSTVPSPAFHGDPQLCEKGSIPEFVGWSLGDSGFVVYAGILFWFGKALWNRFLAKIPLEQFWLSWIQVLLKSVRLSLCLLVQEICVSSCLHPLSSGFLLRCDIIVCHHWCQQH